MATQVHPATSVRRGQGSLRLRPTADAAREAVAAVRDALAAEGSIGVIAADAGADAVGEALAAAGVAFDRLDADSTDVDARVELVPATLAKGLEYDHVVVVEPAAIVRAEPRGLRRLYVVLTRAVTSLAVVHAEPLPDPLTERTPAA